MFLLTAFHQNCVSLHFQKVESPLEFLGLYKTHHDASSRDKIPALVISGDSRAEQIFQIREEEPTWESQGYCARMADGGDEKYLED